MGEVRFCIYPEADSRLVQLRASSAEFRNRRTRRRAERGIEMEGLRRVTQVSERSEVPVDYRDFKAREISPNTFFDTLMKISGIKVSKVESMN